MGAGTGSRDHRDRFILAMIVCGMMYFMGWKMGADAAAAEALDYVTRIDFYAPYTEALDKLQSHYEHCKKCARWWQELTKERE